MAGETACPTTANQWLAGSGGAIRALLKQEIDGPRCDFARCVGCGYFEPPAAKRERIERKFGHDVKRRPDVSRVPLRIACPAVERARANRYRSRIGIVDLEIEIT